MQVIVVDSPAAVGRTAAAKSLTSSAADPTPSLGLT